MGFQVSVPDVTGAQYLDAVNALNARRLNIGTVAYEQSAEAINSVTLQSPAAATMVSIYTGINLTVCSGPVVPFLPELSADVPDVATTP